MIEFLISHIAKTPEVFGPELLIRDYVESMLRTCDSSGKGRLIRIDILPYFRHEIAYQNDKKVVKIIVLVGFVDTEQRPLRAGEVSWNNLGFGDEKKFIFNFDIRPIEEKLKEIETSC